MSTVYLTYGVGIGVGIALVYTPAIACVQPWFSQRRGLAAGIASAGIGAGTLVVPLLAASAINGLGWRDALRVVALGVLVIGTLYTGAALGNLLGPVVAGAVFDSIGSYSPVIWACIALSALATLASWRLVGLQRTTY